MRKQEIIEYNIDYDIFTTSEVVKIINFFKEMEKYHEGKKVNIDNLKQSYKEYRTILGSKTLEKKYDKFLDANFGFTIYKTMRDINSENR